MDGSPHAFENSRLLRFVDFRALESISTSGLWNNLCMTEWQRLSLRGSEPVEEVLFDDIPGHLVAPLEVWWATWVSDEAAAAVAMKLRIGLASSSDAEFYLRHRCIGDGEMHLDVLDCLLSMDQSCRVRGGPVLQDLLTQAGSVWAVSADFSSLQQRVAPELTSIVSEIVSGEGSAAEHLARAWSELYGRSPDPSKAYSEAIKAMEAAAAPIISPKDLKATLGTINAAIRAKPSKFQTVLGAGNAGGSIEPVLALMDAAWKGQGDRHGGIGPTVPVSVEQAQMIVSAAVIVVHWFALGSVTVVENGA